MRSGTRAQVLFFMSLNSQSGCGSPVWSWAASSRPCPPQTARFKMWLGIPSASQIRGEDTSQISSLFWMECCTHASSCGSCPVSWVSDCSDS